MRASRLLGLSWLQANGSAWFLLCLPRLFARCLALEGLSRLEVVTVTWDPRPREPVEGVLRATSVLELAATRRTLELRGKRWLGQWRVSHLQSSRGWSGTPRMVRSTTRRRSTSPVSHCLAPCGPKTTWRGQAWDRSPSRLWRLLLCYFMSCLTLTRRGGLDLGRG